LTINLT